MSRSIRLRRWQKDALDQLDRHHSPDFLAVATPGAGKTTFALTAVVRHLKVQWARAASSLGIHLEPSWAGSDGSLPSDMHGVAVTYQQVAANPDALRRHSARLFVVLDELHHAGDERAWGTSVRSAFEGAPRRLSLSGTPFRSDTHAIPFVNYVNDEAQPDFDYGYAAALADRRVVRPVYFPAIGGHMEWSAPDGSLNAATFDDALDRTRSSQRLRTALSLDGEWLPAVLRQADERLRELRLDQPDAGGLVIATDQEHARGIADLLKRRLRSSAMVVTSDDPSASMRISAFADGDLPWLVAVRMVSEGVDIPRLRIGVFATTTGTELFFRQVVGRFVRHTGGPARNERAWLFIPDDPKIRGFAHTVAEQRRHSLRRVWEDGERPEGDEADPTAFDELPGDDEQLSLFQVLSAEATVASAGTSVWDDDPSLDGFDDEDDTTVPIDLPLPPPPLGQGGRGAWGFEDDGRSMAEIKRDLRTKNADLVAHLVRVTGLSHQEVNGRLNREVSVSRIAEATAEQLRIRAERAEKWIANL